MFIQKKSAPKRKGTIFQKSAPGATVLQKKVRNGALFKKKGTIWYPFSRGVLFRSKTKVENSTPLKKGTILVPLRALFSLMIMFMKQYHWVTGAPK